MPSLFHIQRFCLFISLLLLFGQCSRKQGGEIVTGTAAESAPAGAVWVASAPNGGRLYLCGTVHVLRESDYPLAPAYEAAYADANKLVFELPPGATDGVNEKMQSLAALPAGQTLEDVVGPELAGKVAEWATKHGLSKTAITRFQPWYVALMIAAIQYSELGAQADQGVDNFFEARAARDKKPGEGLETVDLQLNLFVNLTPAQQQDLLKQTLAEVKTMSEDFNKLLNAWKMGDLAALHELLNREAEQYPELLNLFLIDRNKAWLSRLEDFLKRGERVMVLVGAAHLTGREGLIELLKAKGYTVERYVSPVAAK